MRYIVKKYSELKKKQLELFYSEVFKDRHASLAANSYWYYRIDYLNCQPIALLESDKIIGHLGLIPIKIKLKEELIPATWYIDLIIHPNYQGKGLGSLLVKEGQKNSKVQLAVCNEAALRVYKKLNWKINLSNKRLARPINPLKWIPFLKELDLKILKSLYNVTLSKKVNDATNLKAHSLSENKEKILDIFKKRKFENTSNIKIERDEDWFKWRLLDFPNEKNLFFFQLDDNYVIVHLVNSKGIRRLNIIMHFYLNKTCELKMYYSLFKWSLENNIDLVWSCLTDENLIKNLEVLFPKKFTKTITIAVTSADKNIEFELEKKPLEIQGVDSDIDSIFII